MANSTPLLSSQPFGAMPDGRAATLFTLGKEGGLRVSITNFGGAITSLLAPDRHGALADVALGYETLDQYRAGRSHFGALVGRFANRIAGGRFTLDGVEYKLPTNDGKNHLHGGAQGFGKVLWDAAAAPETEPPAVRLSLLSPDGDAGYPGNLHVDVIYSLAGADTLRVEYRATCDRPTPVNFTNHSYFNLAGHSAGTIEDHELTLFAPRYTPVDRTLIPTGEIVPVAGTPLDFSQSTRIGDRIASDFEQMQIAKGYDHNFVIDPAKSRAPVLVARVHEPKSGRLLEVLTTEPGVQFYTGNFLDGTEIGKGGAVYRHRNGFCLETQHFPDSPNQPNFPDCILRPVAVFQSVTLYRFTAQPA